MSTLMIEAYEAGAGEPATIVKGLTRKELNTLPQGARGSWTIQQIVLHLMDSDLIATDRMKRIIAEDNPTIIGYDENKFAANLHYDRMDAAMAAEIFRLNRLLTASLLKQLPESAFSRAGMHNERGRITLGELVKVYAEHEEHHMTFAREKRKLLGKPLG